MTAAIPNLAGVATKDLVETIGAGSFKASYINWARTFNLLHEHAPGWFLETLATPDGGLVFRAPGNGGYLMLRLVHVDGTVLPAVPQAIMDNRNQPIAFDKISARDVTDTHRRGGCMAVAMTFGLAHELWAKMPLESGYGSQEGDVVAVAASTPKAASQAAPAAEKALTREDFLQACLEKGLNTYAAERLIEVIGTNFAGGIKTLASKSADWVTEQNAQVEPTAKATKTAAKKTTKPSPDEY